MSRNSSKIAVKFGELPTKSGEIVKRFEEIPEKFGEIIVDFLKNFGAILRNSGEIAEFPEKFADNFPQKCGEIRSIAGEIDEIQNNSGEVAESPEKLQKNWRISENFGEIRRNIMKKFEAIGRNPGEMHIPAKFSSLRD